jgi:hypothetical protein
LAQIGHRFGFRLIVEEGLSHAVLTQAQSCEPVIVNPNGRCATVKDLRGSMRPEIVMVWFRGFEHVATEWAQ